MLHSLLNDVVRFKYISSYINHYANLASNQFQMQLFVPDPDTFISDKKTDEAEVAKMESQKLEMVRADSVLSGRFIAVAKEAIAYGILDGL